MTTPTERNEREMMQAMVELTKLEAMKVLITNNDLGAELNVAGIIVGVSLNSNLLPLLEYEADQIQKYLNGEPNTYE